MNNENKKVISIRLIYILPIIAMIITMMLYATKNFSIKTEQIAKNSEQEEINVASIKRKEKIETTSRSEEITRNNDELQNEKLQAENNEGQKEEVVVEEQKAENTNEEQEENLFGFLPFVRRYYSPRRTAYANEEPEENIVTVKTTVK